MSLATMAGAALTAELRPQVALLIEDMRERLSSDAAATERWRAQHREAVAQERTAGSWTDFCDDQLTQAAVGWLLTSVFVRFCEDNLLLGESAVWITHADSRLRQRAMDAENAFYQADPDRSYREWLEVSFDALRSNHATAPLVDEHAAIGIISPSSDAVHQLLQFWRRTDDDGNLLWRFDDEQLSTRFLGDLYQDLSEYAKKKYALLQTPVFVEEFILEQTLIPALKERPLEGFRLIDPTCGSGHFLLGAFAILVDRWHREAPGMEVRARVDKALASVYGVDVNPFAVAIATFRLIVAALRETGDRTLVNAPGFTLNLASGDSLLHGPDAMGRTGFDYGDESFDKDAAVSRFSYRTEDVSKLRKFLTSGQYDVVVGNPPYITVKDKALNDRYREIYRYCKGTYALTVPFMERFFQLAKPGKRAGWVGQITSNSFMKRQFGARLIEEFLSNRDLRLVADTSGAYIPGHGTPTVIMVGRNHPTTQNTVRAVLGIKGEPGAPDNPAKGKVWTAIVDHLNEPGYQDQWISVTDLPRNNLNCHPWSLTGGGAAGLLAKVNGGGKSKLADLSEAIGRTTNVGEDAAWTYTKSELARINRLPFRQFVAGEHVRNYCIAPETFAINPYADDANFEPLGAGTAPVAYLWPMRTVLAARLLFGNTMAQRGLPWWAHLETYSRRLRVPLSITFAEVATHNHFVLDYGGKVFKQTAPVIKLRVGATEEDHLQLLGTLNSSTACFWLKQNSHKKGGGGHGGGAADQPWSHTYQFTGTTLQDFPLSEDAPTTRAHELDSLARQQAAVEPGAAISTNGATRSVIDHALAKHASIWIRMITEQEELDWEVYRNYGLIDDELFMTIGQAPGIDLGERAFEISLARKAKAGEVETAWFSRHGSRPITELPEHWPAEYRDLVERRLAAIESNPFIRLLETPECKRRWSGETWEAKLERALRDWLLDKLESKELWFTPQGTPRPMSVGELAGYVEKDPEFIAGLDLWAGQKDAPVTPALEKLLAEEVVPYLAAMRYQDSGLRKRAEWEHVWSLQRDEDAGLIKATDIPIPPKYTGTDFVKQSYWSHRGKLDVPKERFIVYPGAGRSTDPTPLLGWAGWDHAQEGIALATIYAQRESEGIALTELVPLVAGIAEVLPWVRQWHSGIDPTFNLDLGEYLAAQLAEKAAAVGVPINDLSDWRPPTTSRRKKK